MADIFKKNKMAFTGEKESFILRALMGKVEAAGIECCFAPFTVNDLNEVLADTTLFALYMDETMKPKEDTLHFLVDAMMEKDGMLILIGEQVDLNYVSELVEEELIYKAFSRPINNDEFVATVKEYFDKSDSGELKKSILIVDDDAQYLSLVRQWLKDNYRVFVVNSGMQAIKFLAKNKVDLILLDHEMPVTSGPKVLEMLRSENETKDIPVIFLTGKGDKESVMAVVALKPEGYFLKTVRKEELLEKLKEFFLLRNV